MPNSAVILMSGGLDSVVSLACALDDYDVKLALTFDYGQKSVEQEIRASRKVCNHYGIVHKVIKLDWLENITQSALVSDGEVPTDELCTEKSMKAVWVPNRNGLFLNIAASFADSYEFTHIIFGANAQEARTFSDNSQEFIDKINLSVASSTLAKPIVVAPLINLYKDDIVKLALEKAVPLSLVRSCYNNSLSNCGKCESCLNLKKALINNKCEELLKELFEDEN